MKKFIKAVFWFLFVVEFYKAWKQDRFLRRIMRETMNKYGQRLHDNIFRESPLYIWLKEQERKRSED